MSYVQEGKTMNWTNGTGVDVPAGGLVLVGSRLGVAVAGIADGKTGALAMAEVFSLPKATGAVTQGALLYWDTDGDPVGGTAGSGALTTTATDNTLAGYAFKAAGVDDPAVEIKLNG